MKNTRTSATVFSMWIAVLFFLVALLEAAVSCLRSDRIATNEQMSAMPKVVNREPNTPDVLRAADSEGRSRSTERRYEPTIGPRAHPSTRERGKAARVNRVDSARASRVMRFQLNPTALRRAINGSRRL